MATEMANPAAKGAEKPSAQKAEIPGFNIASKRICKDLDWQD